MKAPSLGGVRIVSKLGRLIARMGTRTASTAILALTLLGSPTVQAGVGSGSDFTPEEFRKLDRGQLVQRRVSQHRGGLRLIGGTSWQVIQASPETVWQALLDTAHYDRMLPQLSEAWLVRDAGDNRTVYLRHGNIAQTSYFLDVHLDRAWYAIRFKLDESRSHRIRAAWGFYSVRPYSRGRSLLTYGVMADIGDGLLTALIRPTVHEWMMKVPWLIKRFVEQHELRA